MIQIIRAGKNEFAVVSIDSGNRELLYRVQNLSTRDNCIKNIQADQRQHEGVTYTPVQDNTGKEPYVFDLYQDGTEEASIRDSEPVYVEKRKRKKK